MHLVDKAIRVIIAVNHMTQDTNALLSTLHAVCVNAPVTGLEFADQDLNNIRKHHTVAPGVVNELLSSEMSPSFEANDLDSPEDTLDPLDSSSQINAIATYSDHPYHSLNGTVPPTLLDTGSPISIISYEGVGAAGYDTIKIYSPARTCNSTRTINTNR